MRLLWRSQSWKNLWKHDDGCDRDYGQIIMIVAMLMEQFTKGIETVAKSETAFLDNHDLFRAIQSDAEAIFSLNFEDTRHFNSSEIIINDNF